MCKLFLKKFSQFGGVKMSEHPTMEVMCHVYNCKFNDDAYCFAPKLEVNALNGNAAKSSDEALCTTFKPE